MPRFLSSSMTIDLLERVFNALLFVLLLPVILIFARRITRQAALEHGRDRPPRGRKG